ncbi:MAG: ATP synthase (F/14-kDa) subunit [Promethearchaeota archaeon]|nr:MAG: ATP synthase (F/14-kDa) subunit [Candidatus Lokiarchaeota archaeon]
MPEKRIHIIGTDDIVLMLGLLGMEGTTVENSSDFMKEFERLTEDSSISLIIIAIDLPEDIIDQLINFKLNNRRPFIFYLPNIFKEEIDERGALLKNIYGSIERLLS